MLPIPSTQILIGLSLRLLLTWHGCNTVVDAAYTHTTNTNRDVSLVACHLAWMQCSSGAAYTLHLILTWPWPMVASQSGSQACNAVVVHAYIHHPVLRGLCLWLTSSTVHGCNAVLLPIPTTQFYQDCVSGCFSPMDSNAVKEGPAHMHTYKHTHNTI